MCFIVRMLNNNGRKLPDAASKGQFYDRIHAANPSGKPLEALFPLFKRELVFLERPKNAKLVYFFIMMSRLYYSVVENTDTQ